MNDPGEDADKGSSDEDERGVKAFPDLMWWHEPENRKINHGVNNEANQVLRRNTCRSRECVRHVLELGNYSADDDDYR